MRSSPLLGPLLGLLCTLCCIASCASAQPYTGQLVDGCYYLDEELMGCMKVTIFQCDAMWSFQMSVPVNSHGDRIILASDFISINATHYSNCYDLSGTNECQICLTFEDISYNATKPSISSPLNYVFDCPKYSEYYDIEYEAFNAEGVPCGDPGYFYPPCNSGRYVSDRALQMEQTTISKVSKQRPPSVKETDDYLWYLGPDGCIYLREMTGEDLLLLCPVASLDSCALDAVLLSTDGLEVLIPLETGQSSSQCIYLDGTRSDEYEVCLQADNVYISDYMVEADLTATFVFSTTHFSDTLRMGSFSWYFPECGESLTDTCTTWIDPYVNPISPGNGWFYPPSFWSSDSPGHSPSSNSPHHSHSDDYDNDGSSIWAWLWLVLAAASVVIVIVVVGVILVGVQLVRKRRQQSQNGDTLYQMMYVGDDLQ